MRKITVEASTASLEAAMEFTGAGVSETVRQALDMLARKQFYRRLLAAAGTLDLGLNLEELREDKEY